jgi:hypothetical protein
MVFHNYVIRHISNRHIKKLPNTEIWVYPNMAAAYQELNMLPIPEYIQKRRKTLYHRVKDRQIFSAARIQEFLMAGTVTFWGAEFIHDD